MELRNTGSSYGFVARVLHWMTALVILAAFPLGFLANRQDLTTDSGIETALLLFSIHKTTGILALTLGVARLWWTLSQPRPAPIHPDRKVENFVAVTVHWALTIALIVVPSAGWLSHAATTDLAPIWWPLGQSLPFIPKDTALSEGIGAIHRLFTRILLAAVALHIVGAVKHMAIDHDKVFARMWRGTSSGPLREKSQIYPALTAVSIWAIALAIGLMFALAQAYQPAAGTQEWPLADAEIIFVDGNGDLLASATAFAFLLAINPDGRAVEKGTLDLTIPLDALEGPSGNFVDFNTGFPLLQFLGTVQGTPPTLTATGPLMIGTLAENAIFEIVIEPTGARITGTAAVPGLSDTFLSIDAWGLRP